MNEDIITSFPEYCDDCDTWHLYHLWAYFKKKRTTYSTCNTDGDHENCSAKEAERILANVDSDWREYSQWVVNHKGKDPLGEFAVKYSNIVKRNIIATFGQWVGASEHGFAFDSLKIGNRTILKGKNVPEPVREYLELVEFKGRWVAPWCVSYEAAREYAIHAGCVGQIGARDGKCGVYVKATVEWNEPRNPETIRKEILAAAKRHLARTI